MSVSEGTIIGVDLGGTKMLAGAVDAGGAVSHVERELTRSEEGRERVVTRMGGLIRRVWTQLPADRQPVAIAVGVPGGVDIAGGIVDVAPNLKWQNVPLAAELSALAGLPVFLDNDVRVAVQGEHAYGVGRGTRTMVGVWVGTGIGGGIIVDGHLHQGQRGVAGEIGHTIMDAKGPKCGCGSRGCIEALASRTAIERDLRKAIKRGVRSNAFKRMKKKGREELTAHVIARLLADGDKGMTKVMTRAQHWLGLFASNLVNALDPEVLVFGGGIAEVLGEEFVQPIRDEARKHFLSKRDIDKVRIVASELKENAPVAGAAFLARQRMVGRRTTA